MLELEDLTPNQQKVIEWLGGNRDRRVRHDWLDNPVVRFIHDDSDVEGYQSQPRTLNGLSQTVDSLRRKGLIERDGFGAVYGLTAESRGMLLRWRRRSGVRS